ncbi:IS3 family transposase [Shigella sonnei]|uniref:IS3 family transposase n=1 Tax=Shigella sonnei TaxID=624 RepID=UPI000DA55697|nr:IS3 family transposase [Shigella sonnei]SRJ97722.1 IS600 ORF2 [Shigella sonnei]
MSRKTQRYSKEFKAEAVRTVLENQLSISEGASRLSLPEGTLGQWVTAARKGLGTPGSRTVADLTYVATQEGWLYLAGIKDVYTCEIVGYAMGERMTKELTGKALFMALRSQRPPAGLIHHSDRGSQYCAYDYRVIQEQSGLKTSMSRKGNCYDNAPMESFWGTLKNESLSHYRFNNRDEAISVIREYIEIFYNRQRRHSRLGNISPAAFREKYHQMAA